MPLPPGYTLDSPGTLPAGYTLDQPEQATQKEKPAPSPSLDWSQVLHNLPASAARLIQGTAPGPTSQMPVTNPSGKFSKAHPDVADKYPMIAAAADSLEDLVHNVTHPTEFFNRDPAVAAQTYGTLARGAFNAATSAPAMAAAGKVADAGAATGAGIKAAAPDAAIAGGMIAGSEAIGQLPGMAWPSRVAIAYPAGRMLVKAGQKGMEAAKQAFAQRTLSRAAAAQRAAGRTPAWSDVPEPPELTSPEVTPIPSAGLPSGRTVGPIPQPPTPEPPPRVPGWQGAGAGPSPIAGPQAMAPIPGKLPSGRTPGSLASQQPIQQPRSATEAPVAPAQDMELLNAISMKLANKPYSKLKAGSADKATIDRVAARGITRPTPQDVPDLPSPEESPAPQTMTIPPKPDTRGVEAHAANRMALAKDAAQALHNNGNGISSADMALGGDQDWAMAEQLTDALRGVPKGAPKRTDLSNPETRALTLKQLRELERIQSVKQQLRDSMQEPTLTSPEVQQQ